MKIGVFNALFAGTNFEDTLDYIKRVGCDTIEIGTGNYPAAVHCDLNALLKSEKKAKEWVSKFVDRGLTISALSCHGNNIHPDKAIATEHHEIFVKTIELAAMTGVKNVITFSGCPGGCKSDTTPNWVTCPWPTDFSDILKYQWEEVAIPYWSAQNDFAKKNKVKIAFEMHPGFIVYNTETMLKIRKSCGTQIGSNFDPSHLFWQGMDPVVSLRALGNAVFHFHAKDCRIYSENSLENGVLDTKSYADEINRSWIFRTVGYGHDADVWKNIISTLRLIGYDGTLSIEHEDSLMSSNEGFEKAVAFLKEMVIVEKSGEAYWA